MRCTGRRTLRATSRPTASERTAADGDRDQREGAGGLVGVARLGRRRRGGRRRRCGGGGGRLDDRHLELVHLGDQRLHRGQDLRLPGRLLLGDGPLGRRAQRRAGGQLGGRGGRLLLRVGDDLLDLGRRAPRYCWRRAGELARTRPARPATSGRSAAASTSAARVCAGGGGLVLRRRPALRRQRLDVGAGDVGLQLPPVDLQLAQRVDRHGALGVDDVGLRAELGHPVDPEGADADGRDAGDEDGADHPHAQAAVRRGARGQARRGLVGHDLVGSAWPRVLRVLHLLAASCDIGVVRPVVRLGCRSAGWTGRTGGTGLRATARKAATPSSSLVPVTSVATAMQVGVRVRHRHRATAGRRAPTRRRRCRWACPRRRRRPPGRCRAAAATFARPDALVTPAAEISARASVEEWVTVARSPMTSSTSATNSSGGSSSWRASSLATGAATISSSVASATPGRVDVPARLVDRLVTELQPVLDGEPGVRAAGGAARR